MEFSSFGYEKGFAVVLRVPLMGSIRATIRV